MCPLCPCLCCNDSAVAAVRCLQSPHTDRLLWREIYCYAPLTVWQYWDLLNGAKEKSLIAYLSELWNLNPLLQKWWWLTWWPTGTHVSNVCHTSNKWISATKTVSTNLCSVYLCCNRNCVYHCSYIPTPPLHYDLLSSKLHSMLPKH